MGSLITTRNSPAVYPKVEVDVNELMLRLKSLQSGCSLEIIQLAILSMLEEIGDAVGEEYKDK